MPGRVAEVLVTDGEVVKAGQELARLAESAEANAALKRAKQEVLTARQALDTLTNNAALSLAQSRAAYLKAKTSAEQAQEQYASDASDENKTLLDTAKASQDLAEAAFVKLNGNRGIDPDQQAALQAQLAAAQASEASAQAMLDALTLKASMDGTVIDLALQPGQFVAAGEPVITLADISSWLVKTDNLTEMEVAGVSVGKKVEIVLDALPDVTLTGEVTHINGRYEEKRGDITYTVTILLTKTDPAMRWGMTAAVHFLP
jgi:multidrug resistance efflux pump